MTNLQFTYLILFGLCFIFSFMLGYNFRKKEEEKVG
jgi:hypothetical protein